MPASDGLDMFCMVIYPPLHHIISVCTPLFLTNSIFIDGELLESMVVFVQALCVYVCVSICVCLCVCVCVYMCL